MPPELITLLKEFPIFAVIAAAVFYVVKYIDRKQVENNTRYDTLDTEYKQEMKQSNSQLIEMTNRSITALENNTTVVTSLSQNVNILLENQGKIENTIDIIKNILLK